MPSTVSTHRHDQPGARGALHLDVVHRGDRRDAARLPRGQDRRDERDQHAHQEPGDQRAGGDLQGRGRQRGAEGVEAGPQERGERDAEEDPDDGGEHADQGGLEEHRPHHLAAGGADARRSPSWRVRWATVILNALKMMKLPTKRAMKANAEQEVAEDVDELLELVARLLGDRLTGRSPRTRPAARPGSGAASTASPTPGSAVTLTVAKRSAESNARWAVAAGERRQRGAGEVVLLAEGDDARQPVLGRARRGDDADAIADREVLVLGRRAVDHHVAAAPAARCPR